MSAAQTFYQFYLKNTQEGQEALNYLHGRHLEDDIIEHFGIGCSPSDMDLLYQSLLKQNHLALDMAEVGLIRLKEKKCSTENSIIYTKILTDFERIGDHGLNIAESLYHIRKIMKQMKMIKPEIEE